MIANKISEVTVNIINDIYNSDDKAALASLRDSRSILSYKAEKVLPIIVEQLSQTGMYEKTDVDKIEYDRKPTCEEQAVFTALRCYAIEQRAVDELVYAPLLKNNSDKENEVIGVSFFTALNKLQAEDKDSRQALNKRVEVLLSNRNPDKIIDSIVRLQSILKAKSKENDLKIDYGELAQDFYWLQHLDQMRNICLKWGRQYFWSVDKLDDKKEQGE